MHMHTNSQILYGFEFLFHLCPGASVTPKEQAMYFISIQKIRCK